MHSYLCEYSVYELVKLLFANNWFFLAEEKDVLLVTGFHMCFVLFAAEGNCSDMLSVIMNTCSIPVSVEVQHRCWAAW